MIQRLKVDPTDWYERNRLDLSAVAASGPQLDQAEERLRGPAECNVEQVEDPVERHRAFTLRALLLNVSLFRTRSGNRRSMRRCSFHREQELTDTQRFYASIKSVLNGNSSENDLTIMPGPAPIVGASRAEAQAKYDQLQSLIDPVIGLAFYSTTDLETFRTIR